MEPKIIVLILTLAMPNGQPSVTVQPMTSQQSCIQRADIEASDPFVASVECAILDDGKLQLEFSQDAAAPEQKGALLGTGLTAGG